MIIQVPAPTGYGGVRRIAVSLPRIDCLIADQPAKYLPELPGADVRPDAPARRPRWTSWDNGGYRRRRERRDEAELAALLGDPV